VSPRIRKAPHSWSRDMNTSAVLIRRLNLKAALSALCLTAIGAVATPAMAQQSSARWVVTDTMKVSLAGLDLSTPDGVRAAHERVRLAARLVCAKVRDSADMQTSLEYITCIDNAITIPMAQIDEAAHKSSPLSLARKSRN